MSCSATSVFLPMPVSNVQLFLDTWEILTGRPTPSRIQHLADLSRWLRRYTEHVFIPAATSDRSTLLFLYGKLQRAQAFLLEATVPTDSTMACQTESVIEVQAYLSGLLFLVTVMVKPMEQAMREIAPFLPLDLHEALYHGGDKAAALMTATDLLHRVCWEVHNGADLGIAYILLHIRGEARWFYPGFCHKQVLEGRCLGHPRYPQRISAHQHLTRSPLARDADLPRYVNYRRWGDTGLTAFPAFLGLVAQAYSREQHIQRTRDPLSLGRGPEMVRTPPQRDPESGARRRRPLQSARRRQQRDAGRGPRIPPLDGNFNSSPYVQRQFKFSLGPKNSAVNFKKYYVNAVRTESARALAPQGPLLITEPGREILLAEYLATPAKRWEPFIKSVTPDQLYSVCIHIPKVVSEYRRRLLQNKMNVAMAEARLPRPLTHKVKLLRGCEGLFSTAKLFIRLILDECAVSATQAKFISLFTEVTRGRVHRVTDHVVNEYQTSSEFDYQKIHAMTELERHGWLNHPDCQVSLQHWDTEEVPNRLEARRALFLAIRQWARNFHIRLPHAVLQNLFWRHRHLFEEIDEGVWRRKEPWPRNDDFMVGRRDKDEHTLLRRPKMSYFCALYEYYCKPSQFYVTGWTEKEAVTYMFLVYYLFYPARFRGRPDFCGESVPVAIVRKKAKCTAVTGRVAADSDDAATVVERCTRDHAHERVIVNTRKVPAHWVDKQFARAWEVAKRNDPLPSREVWSLKDLSDEIYTAQSRLRVLPQCRDTCLRCGCSKPRWFHGRVDCNSMFTNADTSIALNTAGPQLLERLRMRDHRDTVTVKHARAVRGHIGGSSAGTFRRFVPTHTEMLQHLHYTTKMTLFKLGSGEQAVYILQIFGTAMGGRGSKILCSLILGDGESHFFADPAWQRRERFFLEGYALEELVAIRRIVDDGYIATPNFCRNCVVRLFQIMWGESQTVSIEEEGLIIKFGDSLVRLIDTTGEFFVTPYFQGSPVGPVLTQQRTRFIPAEFQLKPIHYIRTLLVGALHRTYQLTKEAEQQLTRTVWELCYHLHSQPNHYSWEQILRSLHGLRLPWAVGAVKTVRTSLAVMLSLDVCTA